MSPRAEVLFPSMRLSLPAYITICLRCCREHTAGCRLCSWTCWRVGKQTATDSAYLRGTQLLPFLLCSHIKLRARLSAKVQPSTAS